VLRGVACEDVDVACRTRDAVDGQRVRADDEESGLGGEQRREKVAEVGIHPPVERSGVRSDRVRTGIRARELDSDTRPESAHASSLSVSTRARCDAAVPGSASPVSGASDSARMVTLVTRLVMVAKLRSPVCSAEARAAPVQSVRSPSRSSAQATCSRRVLAHQRPVVKQRGLERRDVGRRSDIA
jgi:hypothetical protein